MLGRGRRRKASRTVTGGRAGRPGRDRRTRERSRASAGPRFATSRRKNPSWGGRPRADTRLLPLGRSSTPSSVSRDAPRSRVRSRRPAPIQVPLPRRSRRACSRGARRPPRRTREGAAPLLATGQARRRPGAEGPHLELLEGEDAGAASRGRPPLLPPRDGELDDVAAFDLNGRGEVQAEAAIAGSEGDVGDSRVVQRNHDLDTGAQGGMATRREPQLLFDGGREGKLEPGARVTAPQGAGAGSPFPPASALERGLREEEGEVQDVAAQLRERPRAEQVHRPRGSPPTAVE